MATFRAWMKGLTAALAAFSCSAPDSSALFDPAEASTIRSETPAIPAPASAAPGDVDDAANAGGGVSTPPGNEGPVAADIDRVEAPPAEPPPSPPRVDAGAAPAADGGLPDAPLAPDAGSEPLPPPPPQPACGGTPVDDICWYLGQLNQTCSDVCAARGGIDPASLARIGAPAQGGSLESCASILEALGVPLASIQEGFRQDGLGFGCHLFVENDGTTSGWWLNAPAFSPTVSNPSARLACGCAR